MRLKKLLSSVLATALAVPNVAWWASPTREAAARERLPATVLATTWGGEHPVAKIGFTDSYGFLELRRPATFFFDPGSGIDNNFPINDPAHCGVPTGGAAAHFTSILPDSLPGPRCRLAIPRFSDTADPYIYVLIGGDAGNLAPTSISVRVNHYEVPASELGPYFSSTCPQLPPPGGMATVVGGGSVKLYSCSVSNGQSANIARIATGPRFCPGFNVISVHQRVNNLFDQHGDDIRSRLIYMDSSVPCSPPL